MFDDVLEKLSRFLKESELKSYTVKIWVYNDFCPVVDFLCRGIRFGVNLVPSLEGTFSIEFILRHQAKRVRVSSINGGRERVADGLFLEEALNRLRDKALRVVAEINTLGVVPLRAQKPVVKKSAPKIEAENRIQGPILNRLSGVGETPLFSFENFQDLPDVLEYSGEFGAEMVLFVPFVHWLSRAGILRNRKVKTYRGMRCFYEGLDCAGFEEKLGQRKWIAPSKRHWLPVRSEHNFDGKGASPYHYYPDYRALFQSVDFGFDLGIEDKPILIVHNKYADEWGRGPVNYIPLHVLNFIFEELKSEFNIVYIRHGMKKISNGFVEDHNSFIAGFDDYELLSRHPEVRGFDELFSEYRAKVKNPDLNRFKMLLYARCYRFISCQGGGAHQIALMGGTLFSILHLRGREVEWAYHPGYYSFMAKNPPLLAICRSYDDMIKSVQLFKGSYLATDRCMPGDGAAETLNALSPARKLGGLSKPVREPIGGLDAP